jgi:hypothetical protein
MGEIAQQPEPGRGDVDPDPDPPPLVAGRGLDQVARDDHRHEQGDHGQAAAPAVRDPPLPLRPDVPPPDQAGGEDQQRREQDVEVLHLRLERVVDHRVRVGRLEQEDHPGVDEPGAPHQKVREVEHPGFETAHGRPSIT